jgi:hypothetical protein
LIAAQYVHEKIINTILQFTGKIVQVAGDMSQLQAFINASSSSYCSTFFRDINIYQRSRVAYEKNMYRRIQDATPSYMLVSETDVCVADIKRLSFSLDLSFI